MKLLLVLLSLTAGCCAVIKTVELMNDATAIVEQANGGR
jgi:hypothetical protein